MPLDLGPANLVLVTDRESKMCQKFDGRTSYKYHAQGDQLRGRRGEALRCCSILSGGAARARVLGLLAVL